MADKYWVGGTGTWNTTLTTNWRTTSGGSTVAAVPTAADNVIFDSNSGGTFTVTMTGALACLSFTVSAGTVTFALGTTPTLSVAGNMSLSTGTVWSSTGTTTFTSTTSRTIATSGTSMNCPITFNGVGGTWVLQDALTMNSARLLSHTNGTIDLNGKTLTVGTGYTTVAGTKNLTFNGGTLVCPTASTTSFNNAVPAGFTTTLGTGSGKISMTAATAKTFVGGGSTYNCTLSNDGAGALTISGSNTFSILANGVQPTTFTFTIATTQTITTSWAISGIDGSLVTINSSTAGTLANISKTSGGFMNYVSLRDISFQPSSATGDGSLPTVWYGGYNSTNLGNLVGIAFVNWSGAFPTSIKTYVITNTATTSWTVPTDWNSTNNIVHLIGAGGGGGGARETTASNHAGGGGGGGGGYTKITNYSASSGGSITVAAGVGGTAGAGAGGTGGTGGATNFGSYTAAGGVGGSTTATPSSVGGTGGVGATYTGGTGGVGGTSVALRPSYAAGGGGGAAGPNGNGGAGGAAGAVGGGGGGGNGGGSAGAAGGASGGAGGNGWLGTGGGAAGAGAGTVNTGGGGGGANGGASGNATGGTGATGADILNTWGSGGGGGGGAGNPNGGTGGTSNGYGAGGGGGAQNGGTGTTQFPGGAGKSGIIVIQYYPLGTVGNFFFVF